MVPGAPASHDVPLVGLVALATGGWARFGLDHVVIDPFGHQPPGFVQRRLWMVDPV